MDNYASNSLMDRLNAVPYRVRFFLALILLFGVTICGMVILFVTGRLI
jgi:hypothetical protein